MFQWRSGWSGAVTFITVTPESASGGAATGGNRTVTGIVGNRIRESARQGPRG